MRGIVLLGPTGVGKTELSLELAEKLNTEIISADSMQVYKFLDIGTAKVTSEEQKRVKHFMIDVIEPTRKYSVGEYAGVVNELLGKFEEKRKIPIIVGGTGLYIDSVTKGLAKLPEKNESMRKELENLPIEELLDELKGVDIESYNSIDHSNKVRVIRAVEVNRISKEKFSKMKMKNIKKNNFDFKKFGLYRDRKNLYDRIDKRVDIMFENGLLEEAKVVYRKYNAGVRLIKAIGYRELIDYFEDKCTLDRAKELIKRNSRRYAKRQLTWFRRDESIVWFDLDKKQKGAIFNEILREFL